MQINLQRSSYIIPCSSDISVPAVDTYVWFARNNMPVLGRVVEVDATLPRPLSVQLMTPEKGQTQVASARFRPAVDNEGQPLMVQLTVQQVVMQVESLTNAGFLRSSDRRRFNAFINS